MWTLAYAIPARIARSTLARSPAAMPCAVGPTTSDATMVPVTVPLPYGHAGLLPPPHRNTATPPATDRCPKWMCENMTVDVNPE